LDKPYAPSCDRNRDPILAVLREHLPDCRSVLEIGSGTGQHAVHFAAAFPSSAHEWLTPDAIATALARPLTTTGVDESTRVPFPNWPWAL
jgi:methylase of polypeptide subunit release factors